MRRYSRVFLAVFVALVLATCAGAGLIYNPADLAETTEPSVSRGQFYTMLAIAGGQSINGAVATNMVDVQPNQTYTGGAVWALSNGIAQCESTTEFGVHTPISRWEIAQALLRYHCNIQATGFADCFAQTAPDLGELTQEALAAVGYASGSGVMGRCENGLFQPYATVSEADVDTILYNFFHLVPVTARLEFTDEASLVVAVDGLIEDIVQAEAEAAEAAQKEAETWFLASDGWTGNWALDFPLCSLNYVDNDSIINLNWRILTENVPGFIASKGETVDDVENHVTNYGTGGLLDCIDVTTILENKTWEIPAGIDLWGHQQYYGYSLQILGIDQQDVWHQEAEATGKDPWQCTWWTWGRAAQYMDLRYDIDLLTYCEDRELMGNAWSYYDNLSPYFLSDWEPSANSIVSWDGASFGHVAYVEAVDDNGIWVSMADSGRTWRGITYIAKVDDPENPYPLYWYANEEFMGFNHLDYDANGWQFTEK
ncbi:MAG: CHAP domain-containing protein [Eubacteriales bacterium]